MNQTREPLDRQLHPRVSRVRPVVGALWSVAWLLFLLADANRVAAAPSRATRQSVAEFDTSLVKLPPRFTGTSPITLYARLLAADPIKGKFETTSDFMDRRTTLPADTLIYAISLPMTYFGFTYDPDSARFEFSCPADESIAFTGHGYEAGIEPIAIDPADPYPWVTYVPIGSVSVSRSQYVGQNAFGASQVISKTVGTYYALSPGPIRGHYLEYAWDLAPSLAAKVKPRVDRVAFIIKPRRRKTWPLAFKTLDSKEATFSSPTERHSDFRCISADILAVWLFNFASGTVLLRSEWGPLDAEDK